MRSDESTANSSETSPNIAVANNMSSNGASVSHADRDQGTGVETVQPVFRDIAKSIESPTPPSLPDYNRIGINFHVPLPRPKIRGGVIDAHTHLVAARHGSRWFEAAKHYGIDAFVTMAPLEEAIGLQRDWAGKIQFICIPSWQEPHNFDDWHRRLDAFYNLGSRIIKFHLAPGTMHRTGWRLDHPAIRKLIAEAVARDMILMSHIGDPQFWYDHKYSDPKTYGTRDEHYRLWDETLREYPNRPWLGAHLGGNPEDLDRLQQMLDNHPNLYLDTSATRWMVREVSKQRDLMRDFVIRNQDRLLWGSDQVSGDDRNFDFLASRFWCHRKLWETAYEGPSPIIDPDFPPEKQPVLRGLALPDSVLQKIYRDNTIALLARVKVKFDGDGLDG